MIFGTYKLHSAENETMLSFCHYVNSYSPEGATNMSTFHLHYSSFTFCQFFCIETVHSVCHFDKQNALFLAHINYEKGFFNAPMRSLAITFNVIANAITLKGIH